MNINSPEAGCSAAPPRRTAPFDLEPGFYEPANLWLYGNTRLLESKLVCVQEALGASPHSNSELKRIERLAEQMVLNGKTLVTGIHSSAHQTVAVVPLRWGAPRIVIFSGGFYYHLGDELDQEPFRSARLWRYEWDPKTDLAISQVAPQKLPTVAGLDRTTDALVEQIVNYKIPGLLFQGSLSHFRL